MKRLQHADPARPWRSTDHYDINAFSMALTYCDVLFAEKHWANKVVRAGLDELNGSTVMTTPEELLIYLAQG
jgi:hypothetical protein